MGGNRELIERKVVKHPGIGFRQLKEKTGLSNGVLQHHLRESDKISRNKGALMEEGYCEECLFNGSCNDKCLKKVLRKQKERKILQLKNRGCSHSEIAEELDLDPSTVSYHINKLKDLGLLENGTSSSVVKEEIQF